MTDLCFCSLSGFVSVFIVHGIHCAWYLLLCGLILLQNQLLDYVLYSYSVVYSVEHWTMLSMQMQPLKTEVHTICY